MSTDLVTVTGHVALAELGRLFADRKIGAVPVVDDENRLIGIVSYMDVLSRLCARG
jgi:CBS domain-containing protein